MRKKLLLSNHEVISRTNTIEEIINDKDNNIQSSTKERINILIQEFKNLRLHNLTNGSKNIRVISSVFNIICQIETELLKRKRMKAIGNIHFSPNLRRLLDKGYKELENHKNSLIHLKSTTNIREDCKKSGMLFNSLKDGSKSITSSAQCEDSINMCYTDFVNDANNFNNVSGCISKVSSHSKNSLSYNNNKNKGKVKRKRKIDLWEYTDFLFSNKRNVSLLEKLISPLDIDYFEETKESWRDTIRNYVIDLKPTIELPKFLQIESDINPWHFKNRILGIQTQDYLKQYQSMLHRVLQSFVNIPISDPMELPYLKEEEKDSESDCEAALIETSTPIFTNLTFEEKLERELESIGLYRPCMLSEELYNEILATEVELMRFRQNFLPKIKEKYKYDCKPENLKEKVEEMIAKISKRKI